MIGLVGCGAIGSRLSVEIQRRLKGDARLIGICDSDPKKAEKLSRRCRPPVPVLTLPQLLSRSQFLIEAASPEAVRRILAHVISRKKGMLVMSTGGLLREPRLLRKAVASSVSIYLPSGAIAGLDGIKAAVVGHVRSVTLTTRKPPRVFAGIPEVVRRKIRLDNLRSPKILFQGTARAAVKAFPQSVNVAATLALAGIGPVRTRVRVIADPSVRDNIHEIEAIGSSGRIFTRTQNSPSRENPRTSQLAVYSAIATLKQIFRPLRVGT